MQTEMEIKVATLDDVADINALANKIWYAHYPGIITMAQIDYMFDKMYSLPSIEEQLSKGHIFLVATIADVPCGYASFIKVGEGAYFLNKLYVDTTLHRKNIGRLLLEECINMCDDIKTMRLQVNRENIKAINFYFKNGFIIEESKDFDIGNGFFMRDFVMIKNFD